MSWISAVVGQPFWRNEIALAAAETLYTDWTRTGLDALTVSSSRRSRDPSNERFRRAATDVVAPRRRLRAGVRSSVKFNAIKHCAVSFGPESSSVYMDNH